MQSAPETGNNFFNPFPYCISGVGGCLISGCFSGVGGCGSGVGGCFSSGVGGCFSGIGGLADRIGYAHLSRAHLRDALLATDDVVKGCKTVMESAEDGVKLSADAALRCFRGGAEGCEGGRRNFETLRERAGGRREGRAVGRF